ncbi:hypothetical protein [Amycolatopsis sp. WQ 127309]|uniref:hypothetical protein n=1 Tax=Amycolatopsis sp. WQ 127309 TaxID=2932773 RepID=UPI001FF30423|nr:hypothetical protein [Amycolatopsis sp. WQ 127309]UOZ03414.1 hypothetical protein MUY22_31730 [Amycolatopsis sp. WQ 127309]
MNVTMTERDSAAGATSTRYHYTRVVAMAGRTVRACVERDYYLGHSCAVVEVLNDQMTWTSLASDAPSNWWYDTPTPTHHLDASAVLGRLADDLLYRAARIVALPPTPLAMSPRVHGAISALLATTYRFDGERRIEPDEVTWACERGGALHIFEHGSGAVTFTKAHRDDCPFITSSGARDCDDECVFPDPASSSRP